MVQVQYGTPEFGRGEYGELVNYPFVGAQPQVSSTILPSVAFLHSTKVGTPSSSRNRWSKLHRPDSAVSQGTPISRATSSQRRGFSGSIWSPGSRFG